MSGSVRVRAERLRVLLAMHQGADSLGPDGVREAFRAGLDGLSRNDLALMDEFTHEDHTLGLACFEIEADLRRRGWVALESLGALLPGADFIAALAELPDDELIEAVRAMLELDWHCASERWRRSRLSSLGSVRSAAAAQHSLGFADIRERRCARRLM